eukprot:15405672-Alexandrium_andersonii.AAC.2
MLIVMLRRTTTSCEGTVRLEMLIVMLRRTTPPPHRPAARARQLGFEQQGCDANVGDQPLSTGDVDRDAATNHSTAPLPRRRG